MHTCKKTLKKISLFTKSIGLDLHLNIYHTVIYMNLLRLILLTTITKIIFQLVLFNCVIIIIIIENK